MQRYHAWALAMLFLIFIPMLQLPLVADDNNLEALANDLESDDEEVRTAAVKALGKLDDPQAVHLLIHSLGIKRPDPAQEGAGKVADDLTRAFQASQRNSVQFTKTVCQTLGGMGAVTFDPLVAALDDQDSSIRSGAARALGYLGDERAIDLLIARLQMDPRTHSSINSGAMSGLRQFGPRAVGPLAAALKNDDPGIRANAAAALGQPNNSGAVLPLIEALGDQDPTVRHHAAMALGAIRDAAAVKPLLALLGDEDPETRATACKSLGWLMDGQAFDPLIDRLKNDDSPRVRMNAARALGRLGDKRAFEPLLDSLKNDPDWMVRGGAASALADVDKDRASEPLLEALSLKDSPPPQDVGETHKVTEHFLDEECDPVENTREITEWDRERQTYLQSVVNALSNIGEPRAIEPLIEMLEEEDPGIRRVAARTLGFLRDQRAVEPLLKATEDPDPRVSRFAVESLQRLGHPRGGEKLGAVDAPEACAIPDQRSRRSAARALAQRAGTDEEIATMLEKDDPEARAIALLALGYQGDSASMDLIANSLADEDQAVRICAVEAMSHLPDPRMRLLVPTMGNRQEDPAVRAAAAKAIADIGKQFPSMALALALQDDDAGIRHEAADGLGNARDKLSTRQLIEALDDEDGEVRVTAARSLARFGDRRALEPLLACLDADDGEIRVEAMMALGQLKNERAVEPLIRILREGSRENNTVVINALGEIGDARAVEPLLDQLDNRWSRKFALWALSRIPDPRAIQTVIDSFGDEENSQGEWNVAAGQLAQLGEPALFPLISALENESAGIRAGAAQALGQMKDERAVDALISTLADDQSEQVRAMAAVSLGWINDQRALEPLTAAFNDPSPVIRTSAVNGLGFFKDQGVINPLVSALDDESADVRTAVVMQLARMDDPGVVDPLLSALADEDDGVRQKAALALCFNKHEDARIDNAFLAAVGNEDLLIISGAYAYLIELSSPDHLPLLEEALMAHGYPEMAQDFLMCGNDRLVQAVKNWAGTQQSRGVWFSKEYCVLCPQWGHRVFSNHSGDR